MENDAKQDLIESAGFTFRSLRGAYVNTKTKKILVEEDVEGRSEEWLRKFVADPNDSDEWRFSTPPAEAVRKAFLAELD